MRTFYQLIDRRNQAVLFENTDHDLVLDKQDTHRYSEGHWFYIRKDFKRDDD